MRREKKGLQRGTRAAGVFVKRVSELSRKRTVGPDDIFPNSVLLWDGGRVLGKRHTAGPAVQREGRDSITRAIVRRVVTHTAIRPTRCGMPTRLKSEPRSKKKVTGATKKPTSVVVVSSNSRLSGLLLIAREMIYYTADDDGGAMRREYVFLDRVIGPNRVVRDTFSATKFHKRSVYLTLWLRTSPLPDVCW